MRLAKAQLALDGAWAQRYIDELEMTDFTVDRCPSAKNGSCVPVLDGVAYLVRLNDGRSATVTRVSKPNGITGQNPALSNWITKLLEEIQQDN